MLYSYSTRVLYLPPQCCICQSTVLTVGGFSFRLLISFETADTETEQKKHGAASYIHAQVIRDGLSQAVCSSYCCYHATNVRKLNG